MIKVSLPYIYKLSADLNALRTITDDKPGKEWLYTLYSAQASLNGLLANSVYSSTLKASKAPGLELLGAIDGLVTKDDMESPFGFFEIYTIGSALSNFEVVLTAEMNVGNVYLVTSKRGFDTGVLIDTAEVIFDPRMATIFPETIREVREAGKCIAFEMGTAAGFHLMRATEFALRRYYDAITKGEKRPERNNMGDYIAELQKLNCGDAKTLAALRQLKDLHRNALMHPDVSLSLDEAIGLLGMTQSVIVALLEEMPNSERLLPGIV